MKANAPEKIWMDLEWIPYFDCKDCITEDSIEYIRKDVFIEKMETWLNKRHKHDRYTLIYFRKHFKNIINEIMKG